MKSQDGTHIKVLCLRGEIGLDGRKNRAFYFIIVSKTIEENVPQTLNGNSDSFGCYYVIKTHFSQNAVFIG